MTPLTNHPYKTSCWTLIAVAVFTLSLAASGYFGWQLRRSDPPPQAGLLAADKGYGVTTDLTQYPGDELTANLDLMYQHGLTWIRQPIPWSEIESQPGEYNWQPYDRLTAAVEIFNQNLPPDTPDQLKLKLIALLHTTPAWARPANTPDTTPPRELSHWGRFTRQLGQRYAAQFDYYQIWHEPNLSVNWGEQYVDPAGYSNLLREATVNIRAVDNSAVIILAGLAPTLEDGPLNLNEMAYLEALYQAQANRWFDVVATQIYGFATEPGQPADPAVLGFSRTELVRQVMLQHDDAETPIWATAFGWAVIEDDWTGRKSLWKQAIPAVQSQRTANAVLYVRRHWPWLGPMLAIRWDTADLAPQDPAAAFALTGHPEILGAFQTMSHSVHVATPGQYPANHLTGRYSGNWRFADDPPLADIPRQEPRTLKIAFQGSRFDLTIHRGPYRAYLWVTVDKDDAAIENEAETFPANALPQDSDGQTYLVLYDPLYGSDTVTLARHLTPGFHEIEITAEGGWGQWAIAGWTVYDEPDTRPYQVGLLLSGLLAVGSSWPVFWLLFHTLVGLSRSLWAWSEITIALYATLGNRIHIALTFGLGIGLYLAPEWLALAILPFLGFTILLRPDLGLMLIVASLSFFQAPVDLPFKDFSPVEFTLALTLLGLVGQSLVYLARRHYAPEEWAADMPLSQPRLTATWPRPAAMDYAALALVIVSLLATFKAQHFGVSMFEWRRVVLESVIFYFLVRVGFDFETRPLNQLTDPPPMAPGTIPNWAWRLVDAFVVGAVAQSLLALYFYFFTDWAVTAEGVYRALGLAYGSPNNLALFLERVWPILLVIVLLKTGVRRWLYGFSLMVVSLTIFLTFSKGALLIGLPLTVIGMALLYLLRQGGQHTRRVMIVTTITLTLLALSLLPLSQTARFQGVWDVSPGSTTFFRLKLWQASVDMLADYPVLGIGLDNFLYQYRTHYILPAAWQEPNLNHPHNLILDFGIRLGVGGIIILLWLQATFWRPAWRLYRQHGQPLVLGLMGSMITFLGHGLVDNSYFLVDLAFVFFLTLGLIQRLSEEDRG